MKPGTILIIGLAAAVLAAGGGYWIGQRGVGIDAKPEPKILYYRNPMGLADTSTVPKKDPMGMDYIPVFEGEAAGANAGTATANQIKISTDKVQKLGVRTEVAGRKSIARVVRASGRIEPDERRVTLIAPKFEGYVERLHINATGQAVGKGQPLFEVYSPELVSAQREYAIAVAGGHTLKSADSGARAGMKQLADSALLRLKNWDISEEQIDALAQSGETKRTLTFRSPVTGIVTEKKALQGMRFMPGEMLYQVTDLSLVWVFADVFEQDIGLVKQGAKATVKINAYPDKKFVGTVTYVYPTMKADTRTVQVRIELTNPGHLLKPGMFAQVEFAAPAMENALTVPLSAVIDSGTRRIVLVQLKEGRFEPREVKLGARGDDYVEVLDGIKEGEAVVVAANFLIDAESNLQAAMAGFGQPTAAVGHHAEGTVDAIDAKAGSVSIHHGAVASLKWPPMTMEFKLANAALLNGLKPGATVAFEFVERQPGEWVVTGIKPGVPGSTAAPAASKAHSGH